jgi:hypothetical protein
VKTFTVSGPDDVYRSAKIRAAEEGTTVNALVAAYLESLSHDKAEFELLVEQQHQIVSKIREFRASDRLDRYELHIRSFP